MGEARLESSPQRPAGPAPGRPKGTTDPEKDQLKNRVEELERQVRLYEQRDKLRTLLKQMEEPDPTGSSTKKNSK